jgi:hypothetical protein
MRRSFRARQSDKSPTALRLDADLLIAAGERLRQRIEARFPASGLGRVCGGLIDAARQTDRRVRRLARPYYLTRIVSGLPIVGLAGLAGYVVLRTHWNGAFDRTDTASLLQGLDALFSMLVLLSGAIIFFVTYEKRLKNREIMRGLFDLRSIAHVIDMHQLTKYPTSEIRLAPTTASMEQELSDPQLARYLDYCIEMLALLGKLAALYAGETQGQEVTSAIGDVEDLTSDLGRRIWQKIQIIDEMKD